jgi:hypothetical protein
MIRSKAQNISQNRTVSRNCDAWRYFQAAATPGKHPAWRFGWPNLPDVALWTSRRSSIFSRLLTVAALQCNESTEPRA